MLHGTACETHANNAEVGVSGSQISGTDPGGLSITGRGQGMGRGNAVGGSAHPMGNRHRLSSRSAKQIPAGEWTPRAAGGCVEAAAADKETDRSITDPAFIEWIEGAIVPYIGDHGAAASLESGTQ